MMPFSMDQAPAGFLKYLAEPAARSLALGCLAAMALAAFRVKRVPLRLFVWTMTLYVALAMPLLGALLPRMTFSVPAAPAALLVQNFARSFEQSVQRGAVRHEAGASNATANSVATGTGGDVKAMATTKTSHVKLAVNQQMLPATSPVATDAARESNPATLQTVAPQKSFSISWMAAALAIYLAVTFLFFARFLMGMFFSWRLERASEGIHEREAVRLLRMRACMGGLESTPRLAETKMLLVPATMGVLHPVILLPTDWRGWDEAKLDAILAHEVSHVARRDALTQRLSLIHRAIFWFSPLAWWIDRQVAELAEEASDEAALAGGADQARYAETLLGFFAELEAAPGRIHWEGISMANGCRAERRVEKILSWKGTISMKKWLAVMIVAVAAPLVFLAASAHPSVAHAQDKPQIASQNKVLPGGPVAPVLPNAPKSVVVAPVLAPAPKAGPVTPANMRPPTPGTAPVAPATLATPSARPVLMPVPGAPAHPPIVPGPIANGPVAPAALAGPVVRVQSSTPVAAVAGSASIASIAPVAPETPMAAAAAQQGKSRGQGYGYGYGWSSGGPRYVIMTGNSDSVTMSGSEEDVEHARNLRKKISGDFIWFERDEKSYVITDPDFIAKTKALFAPQEALGKQQEELGRQQEALGAQQEALGEKMEDVKVKVRDITPQLEEVRARIKELQATGATQRELGRLQADLGELQREVGRSQSQAGAGQGEIGHQQGELGRKQGELGRRQGELGRQQGELARKASRELRGMFDDAIAKGIAKPE